MPVYHSSQVLDQISKKFAFRWFAFQARSFHTTKDLIESINVVCRGGCCYDHVIQVAHQKIPVLLPYSGQSLSHQSLKERCGVAQAKGHPLLLVQPQFTCESGLFSVLLPQRDLPEGRAQVQCCEELGIAKFREALIYPWYRVSIFYCYCVQVTKVATKPKLPPFLFGHEIHKPKTTSRVLSCRIQATFLFLLCTPPSCQVSCALHLPYEYGERCPLLVRFRVRQKCNIRYPPYVLKNIRVPVQNRP